MKRDMKRVIKANIKQLYIAKSACSQLVTDLCY